MSEDKSVGQLWHEYLFLTSELRKFVSADDADLALCEDLLSQRRVLFERIALLPGARDYAGSDDGREMFKLLARLDKELRQEMLKARNFLQKEFELSSAYEGFSGNEASVGTRFDSGGR